LKASFFREEERDLETQAPFGATAGAFGVIPSTELQGHGLFANFQQLLPEPSSPRLWLRRPGYVVSLFSFMVSILLGVSPVVVGFS
jgi:hypothetical protein